MAKRWPTWLVAGVDSLVTIECRVWEFDKTGLTGSEVPIKRYAIPESFSKKKAKRDLWMGNMMWWMRKHKGIKLTGEQARKIMYTYMSSPFYRAIVEKWASLKVERNKPKYRQKLHRNSAWYLPKESALEAKSVRIPIKKKLIRKPMRRPM